MMRTLLNRGVFVLLAAAVALKAPAAFGQIDGQDQMAAGSSDQPVLTITEIGEKDDVGRVVKVLPDGTILTAGSTNNGKDDDFALLKYSGLERDEMGNPLGISSRYYKISTIPVSNVTRNSAMTGGNIVSRNKEGEPAIIQRGVCYSVNPLPVYRDTTDETDSSVTGDGSSVTVDAVDSSPLPDHRYQTSYNYDTVKSGCTSDGTGDGLYGSHITQITPGTPYYVRAYAILSTSATTETLTESSTLADLSISDPDSGVIYGNQLTFITEDACFIATAAFGSILDKHVVVLRQFRDTYLKTTELGSRLVDLYYSYSPALAEIIEERPVLRFAVRILLIPLVLFSTFMLQTSLKVKLLLSVLCLSSAVVFIYKRSRKFNLLENQHVAK